MRGRKRSLSRYSLCREFGGGLGDMPSLGSGDGEFVGGRLALAVGAGDGGGAVGGAARDFGEVEEFRGAVGDPGDEHSLVEEEGGEGEQGGFLSTVLAGGGGEG